MEINLQDDEIMGTDLDYKSLEELLFVIEKMLEENEDEELEELSIKLGEYNYYNYTNK